MSTSRPPFTALSVAANRERHKIASDEPFLQFIVLQYPGAADPTALQQYVRLVRNLDPVTFDCGDGHGPQEYQPFNFDLGDLAVSTTGQVPELELKVSNVMRVLQTTIENYGGVVGGNLSIYLVNTANPSGEPDLALSFTVKQATCDAKLVTFKLGAASPLRRLFPLFMYRPNYCGWTYNSPALQSAAYQNPTYRNPGKQCGYAGPTATVSTTTGSTTVTVTAFNGQPISGALAINVGWGAAGPGIPAGTTILAVGASTLTLSAAATATASSIVLWSGIASCSKTIDGATGCKAHFPTTPLRGLFFPGIDSNGAAVASVA